MAVDTFGCEVEISADGCVTGLVDEAVGEVEPRGRQPSLVPRAGVREGFIVPEFDRLVWHPFLQEGVP